MEQGLIFLAYVIHPQLLVPSAKLPPANLPATPSDVECCCACVCVNKKCVLLTLLQKGRQVAAKTRSTMILAAP